MSHDTGAKTSGLQACLATLLIQCGCYAQGGRSHGLFLTDVPE